MSNDSVNCTRLLPLYRNLGTSIESVKRALQEYIDRGGDAERDAYHQAYQQAKDAKDLFLRFLSGKKRYTGYDCSVLEFFVLKTIQSFMIPVVLGSKSGRISKLSFTVDGHSSMSAALPFVFMFENLESFSCTSSPVRWIPDNLPESLKVLNCSDTHIEALPKQLPPLLEYLYLSGSHLRALPEHLPPKLFRLECNNTSLESLPTTLPDTLDYIDIRETPIVQQHMVKYIDQLRDFEQRHPFARVFY